MHPSFMNKKMDFLRRRIINPILSLLQQGLSPEKLSLSLAFGITGGLFPIPGATSIVCAAFVYFFKLNLIACQITNILMTPVELALVVPFIKTGDYMFGVQSFKGSISDIKDKMKEDFFGFLSDFWVALLHGIVAWALFTVLTTYILHMVLLPILKQCDKKKNSLD